MLLPTKAFALWLKTTILCSRTCLGAYGISYRILKNKNKEEHKGLKKFKDIYAGKKCFIIGTGPSLKAEDVKAVIESDAFVTFGVNTLYKIYDELGLKADYYCIIDPSTYGSVGKSVKKYHTDTFFIPDNRIKNEKEQSINKFALECSSFYKFSCLEYFGYPKFGFDLSDEIYDGASVVYATMQIAAYMGFSEIYLLGVDCNYDKNQQLHNEKLSYEKGYKYKWTKQTGISMIDGFQGAKDQVDAQNIQIYNATRGGMLEVFPRVDFDEVVKG